jgi:hypothetical protein
VPVQVAVLERHAGALRRLGGEPDLDLAAALGLGLELPSRADVPAEHHAIRRVVGQDPRPAALAAVGAPVGDVATDLRVEDRLGDRRTEQVVLAGLEVAEPFGEHRECPVDRCLDDDLAAHHHVGCLGHGFSSLDSSATSR